MMEQVVKMIDFEDGQILGVKDENGQIWMGVRKACLDIGLSDGQARRQVENVQTDKVLREGVANLRYPTNGGVQEVWCIQEEIVTLWLAKINITPTMERENPIATERLVKYQKKAAKVLHEAFMGNEEKKQQFYDDLGIHGEIVEMKNIIIKQNTQINNLITRQEENSKVISLINTKLKKMESKHDIMQNESTAFSILLAHFNAKIYKSGVSGSKPYYRLYEAIKNFTGETIPSEEWLKLHNYKNPKDYIIQHFGIDFLIQFDNGILDERIIQSKQGNWIDLSGVYNNNYEWEKIKKEYTDKEGNLHCAYCGKVISDAEAQKEHMIHKADMNSSDCIWNIVPACDDCNGDKYSENYDTWYPRQKFFRQDLYDYMVAHRDMYLVDDKYIKNFSQAI